MLIQKSQKELQTQIQKLSNELSACKNIEKQHKKMNGLLYEEVDRLKKANEKLKKENAIHKKNIQDHILKTKFQK